MASIRETRGYVGAGALLLAVILAKLHVVDVAATGTASLLYMSIEAVLSGGAAEVPLGSAVVKSGELLLGQLSLDCDGELAGQLWGAGAALASHLLSPEGRVLLADQPDVVELGAGLGLVGLAAALAGAGRVTLTDLIENVPRLEHGITKNQQPIDDAGRCHVTAAALPFGDLDAVYDVAPDGCDLVLGALACCLGLVDKLLWVGTDLCYNPDLFEPLLATLHELAQVQNTPTSWTLH